MKPGDLVRTTGFGPGGSVGEIGIILEDTHSFGTPCRIWKVCFFLGTITLNIAWQGLEVISES